MSWIKAFFQNPFKKREPIITRIEIIDGGFVTSREDGYQEQSYWKEIERIYTYKVDCYAYDMIWLVFEREGKAEIYIREEAMGFSDFMTAMSKAFPSIDSQWYFTVQMPPFAENFTILFEREKSPAS